MRPGQSLQTSCLFLDVDGTLLDIAHSPAAVVVPPSLLHSLVTVERRLDGALALISGRTIQNLDELFTPLRLKASGVHGAEFRFADGSPIVTTAEPLPEAAWTDLLVLLGRFPGCMAENKRFSFAIHYRAMPEVGDELRVAMERFLAARPKLGLRILPGHFVFELKTPDINKGAAIARLLNCPPFEGRTPMFVGDDVTDHPGFAVVAERGGSAFSVGDTHPEAAGTFRGPADVRNWLATLGRQEALTA